MLTLAPPPKRPQNLKPTKVVPIRPIRASRPPLALVGEAGTPVHTCNDGKVIHVQKCSKGFQIEANGRIVNDGHTPITFPTFEKAREFGLRIGAIRDRKVP